MAEYSSDSRLVKLVNAGWLKDREKDRLADMRVL